MNLLHLGTLITKTQAMEGDVTTLLAQKDKLTEPDYYFLVHVQKRLEELLSREIDLNSNEISWTIDGLKGELMSNVRVMTIYEDLLPSNK